KGELLHVNVANGKFMIQPLKGEVLAEFKADLLETIGADFRFEAARGFRRPMATAGTDLKAGEFTLSSARTTVKPHVSSLGFKVLGIPLGLSLPGYSDLTTGRIIEL